MLFTLADAHQLSGNWDINLSGFLSALDLETGQWRNFDTYRNLGTDELFEMIGQQGEILVTSNRALIAIGRPTTHGNFSTRAAW